MRIVVVGSKPNARIPAADVYLFCNGAVSLSKSYRAKLQNIHVGSYKLFHRTTGSPIEEARRLALKGALVDRTFLVKKRDVPISINYLNEINYRTNEWVILKQTERDSIVRRSSGLTIPFNDKFRDKQFLRNLLLYRLGAIVDTTHKYRPSTGAFAVALAVDKFVASEIIIAGISFDNSGYEYNGRKFDANRGHLPADRLFFSALARSIPYLFSTDMDLSRATGIEYV